MDLLVGIAVGVLVVIAAIGSLVYTRMAATVVNDNTRLQQRSDAIFRNLEMQVTQAGAMELRSHPAGPSKLGFSAAFEGFNPVVTGAATGQVFAVHGINGADNTADTLRVSFEDNGRARDCLGNRPSGTPDQQTVSGATFARIDSQYSVQGEQLMCKGAANTSAQSLDDGIEDFQVLYAVRTSQTPSAQLQFFSADQISNAAMATPNWTQVLGVRVCLQIVGDSKGNPQPGLSTQGCRGQSIPADGRLRRVSQRTFAAVTGWRSP